MRLRRGRTDEEKKETHRIVSLDCCKKQEQGPWRRQPEEGNYVREAKRGRNQGRGTSERRLHVVDVPNLIALLLLIKDGRASDAVSGLSCGGRRGDNVVAGIPAKAKNMQRQETRERGEGTGEGGPTDSPNARPSSSSVNPFVSLKRK